MARQQSTVTVPPMAYPSKETSSPLPGLYSPISMATPGVSGHVVTAPGLVDNGSVSSNKGSTNKRKSIGKSKRSEVPLASIGNNAIQDKKVRLNTASTCQPIPLSALGKPTSATISPKVSTDSQEVACSHSLQPSTPCSMNLQTTDLISPQVLSMSSQANVHPCASLSHSPHPSGLVTAAVCVDHYPHTPPPISTFPVKGCTGSFQGCSGNNLQKSVKVLGEKKENCSNSPVEPGQSSLCSSFASVNATKSPNMIQTCSPALSTEALKVRQMGKKVGSKGRILDFTSAECKSTCKESPSKTNHPPSTNQCNTLPTVPSILSEATVASDRQTVETLVGDIQLTDLQDGIFFEEFMRNLDEVTFSDLESFIPELEELPSIAEGPMQADCKGSSAEDPFEVGFAEDLASANTQDAVLGVLTERDANCADEVGNKALNSPGYLSKRKSLSMGGHVKASLGQENQPALASHR
eukprot:c1616_g1_i2 orf=599-1999(+)